MFVLSPNAGRFLSVVVLALPKDPTEALPVATRPALFRADPTECELSPPKCNRSPLRDDEMPALVVSRERDVVGWRWREGIVSANVISFSPPHGLYTLTLSAG